MYKLKEYLAYRAEIEGVRFNLDEAFFESGFNQGFRVFFGVHLNDLGEIIFDEDEPVDGFLIEFLTRTCH